MRTALLILAGKERRLPTSGDFHRAGFTVSTAVAMADRPGQAQGALQGPMEPGDGPNGETAGIVERNAGDIPPATTTAAAPSPTVLSVKNEDSAQTSPGLPPARFSQARFLRADQPEDGYSTSS